MRVTCPNCSAAYEVPEAKIGAGRKLRCARCRHDWWVDPPAAPAAEGGFARSVAQATAGLGVAPSPGPAAAAEAPLPPPPAAPPPPGPAPVPDEALGAPPVQPPAPPRPPRQPRPIEPALPRLGDAPPQGRTTLILAWVASLLFMLGTLAALLLLRAELAEAWPPLERLYQALGLGTRE